MNTARRLLFVLLLLSYLFKYNTYLMKFSTINLVYFSPTNNTKKIARSIAKGTGVCSINEIDLTHLSKSSIEQIEIKNQLTIIGAPVYRGRISEDAAKRLKNVKAENSPAIVVAVYGNRGYDDALIELKNIVQEIGFEILSAAAFVGEHSFSGKNKEIAHGRPDKDDINFAIDFGKQSYEKLMSFTDFTENKNLNIQGNFPYKTNDKMPPLSPVTIEEKCTKCGKCVQVCPVDAVKLNHKIITDKTVCILCGSCIKNCKNNAREFNDPALKKMIGNLFVNCQERKESEFFL